MSRTLKTNAAPTNDAPNYFTGYTFRLNGGSAGAQRPSSAGTSRSRSSSSKTPTGTTNIFANPTINATAGIFGQGIQSANRPQSAGHSRPSSQTSAMPATTLHIPAVPQPQAVPNKPGVVNLAANPPTYPAFPHAYPNANINGAQGPNINQNFLPSRPKSASSARTSNPVMNFGTTAGSSNPINSNSQSKSAIPNIAPGVNMSNNSNSGVVVKEQEDHWKTSYKLHYGYGAQPPNNASSTSQTPVVPIPQPPNAINSSNSGSSSGPRPSSASNRIRHAITESHKYTPDPNAAPASNGANATQVLNVAMPTSHRIPSSSAAASASAGVSGVTKNDSNQGYSNVVNLHGNNAMMPLEFEEDDEDVDMGLDADMAVDIHGERRLLQRDDNVMVKNPHQIVNNQYHNNNNNNNNTNQYQYQSQQTQQQQHAINKRTTNPMDEDDDDEMDGRPVCAASRSHPEVSIITGTVNSQSVELVGSSVINNNNNNNNNSNGVDGRNSSIDSFNDENIDVGLSTVPNQFCTKRDAMELKKLVLMTSHNLGGIVPSSSAVMDMYMVGKVIGVGSYGKVRAAWHRLTGAKVAIKTYDKAKMKDPSHWKRVYSEIKIMEQISHPRIARMYEAVETPKRMHLIMECLDGGNLCSYVKQKKRLTEDESRRIFFQILQAIEHLHTLGVSHRDIKLENVLFTDSRDIKLIDFGFSTVCQPGKMLKVFCGTPSYMAPEIVRRTEYEGKPVDMWSLGILLYALLCGCFPFRAKTYPDLYRRIARGTFTIPDELSASVKDLLRQLLCVDVSQRITAYGAIRHSWLQVQFQHAPDLDKMRRDMAILISERPADDINEDTVAEIIRYGITKDEVVKSILTKTHSAIATLYYLLLDIVLAKKKYSGGSGGGGKKVSQSFPDRIKSATSHQVANMTSNNSNNINLITQQQQQNQQQQQQQQQPQMPQPYNYNPMYVMNYQPGGGGVIGPSAAAAQARPRSASAARAGGTQRPLSAYARR